MATEIEQKEPPQLYWKQAPDNQWILFQRDTLPEFSKPKSKKKTSKDDPYDLWVNPKKGNEEGATVYTPKGFGTIKSTSDDKITVEIKSKTLNFPKDQVKTEIPINVKYISPMTHNDYTLVIQTDSTTEELFELVDDLVGTEYNYCTKAYCKGMEIRKLDPETTLAQLDIKPDSNILVISSIYPYSEVLRFDDNSSTWKYNGSADAICVTATKRVKMVGFGVYRPLSGKTLDCVARVYKGKMKEGECLIDRQFIVNSDEDNRIHPFIFDDIVVIEPGQTYTLWLSVLEGGSHYGQSSKTVVSGSDDEVSFTFAKSSDSFNGTDESYGQIPTLYYYF